MLKSSIIFLVTLCCLPFTANVYGVEHSHKIKTGIQIADALDSMIQPRFQKNAGMFGESRIGINGHMNIEDFLSQDPGDKKIVNSIVAGNRVFTTGFFHCVKKPGTRYIPNKDNPESLQKPTTKFGKPTYYMFELVGSKAYTNGGDGVPESQAANWDKRHHAEVLKACLADEKYLLKGIKRQRKLSDSTVYMRPILASKAECVGCHAGARLKDTLGVMVYTVRDKPRSMQLETSL